MYNLISVESVRWFTFRMRLVHDKLFSPIHRDRIHAFWCPTSFNFRFVSSVLGYGISKSLPFSLTAPHPNNDHLLTVYGTKKPLPCSTSSRSENEGLSGMGLSSPSPLLSHRLVHKTIMPGYGTIKPLPSSLTLLVQKSIITRRVSLNRSSPLRVWD